MRNVSRMLLTFAAAAATLSLCSVPAWAQDTPQKSQMSGHNMTVTGCLQKGDETGEYTIMSEDGKTYDVRSTSVNLSNHINHKVTLTGRMTPENEKEERGKTGTKEAGNLTVTNLKMVSTSCQ